MTDKTMRYCIGVLGIVLVVFGIIIFSQTNKTLQQKNKEFFACFVIMLVFDKAILAGIPYQVFNMLIF